MIARDTASGEERSYDYDQLVIAVGAEPVRAQIPGAELKNVFTLRSPRDADEIIRAVRSGEIKRAVIAGGSARGIKLAENLSDAGVRVSIACPGEHILPEFDRDYADYMENELSKRHIPVLREAELTAIEGEGSVEKLLTKKRPLKTNMLVFDLGLRPNTTWLRGSGIELAPGGEIPVDGSFRTNDPDVYACGDCVLVKNLLTEKAEPSCRASSAALEGRLLAGVLSGAASHPFHGVLQTRVFSLYDLKMGKTGLSAEQAAAEGFDAECATIGTDAIDKRMTDSSPFLLRAVADKGSRRLLGVEVIGKGNVDKILDTAVAAISMGATLEDVEDMDFAFEPSFSTPIQPLAIAVHTLQNKIDGKLFGDTLDRLKPDNSWIRLDVSRLMALPRLRHVEVSDIRGEIEGIPLDANVALICPGGRFSNIAEMRMRGYGYRNVFSIEGGILFNYALTEDDSN